jgi:hypothetical protein
MGWTAKQQYRLNRTCHSFTDFKTNKRMQICQMQTLKSLEVNAKTIANNTVSC